VHLCVWCAVQAATLSGEGSEKTKAAFVVSALLSCAHCSSLQQENQETEKTKNVNEGEPSNYINETYKQG
jgi:hypothetical protein